MYELDITLTQAINGLAQQSGTFDFLMTWISAIGVPLLILAVAVQWWSRTDRLHTRHILVATGLSFLLSLAFNQLILLFVHRLRPYDGVLYRPVSASSAILCDVSEKRVASERQADTRSARIRKSNQSRASELRRPEDHRWTTIPTSWL